MKMLGFSALAMTLLSLVLWFVQWVLVTFFLPTYAMVSPLRYVWQGASLLSALAEFVAIGLLAVGLILAAGKAKKDTPPAGPHGE